MKKLILKMIFLALFCINFNFYAAEQTPAISRWQQCKTRLAYEFNEFKKCVTLSQDCDPFRRNMYIVIGVFFFYSIMWLVDGPTKRHEKQSQDNLASFSHTNQNMKKSEGRLENRLGYWDIRDHELEIEKYTKIINDKLRDIEKLAGPNIFGPQADEARLKFQGYKVINAEYEKFGYQGPWLYKSQFEQAKKYLQDMITVLDKAPMGEGQQLGGAPAVQRPAWTQEFLKRRQAKP